MANDSRWMANASVIQSNPNPNPESESEYKDSAELKASLQIAAGCGELRPESNPIRIQNPESESNPCLCVTRARENRRADAPPQGRDRVPGGPGVRAADAGTVPGRECDAGTPNHEGLSRIRPPG